MASVNIDLLDLSGYLSHYYRTLKGKPSACSDSNNAFHIVARNLLSHTLSNLNFLWMSLSSILTRPI